MVLYIAFAIRDRRLYELGKEFSRCGYEAVPIDQQHLTILFIGDVDSYHRHLLEEKLSCFKIDHPRILSISGVELLPRHKATNVVLVVDDRNRVLHQLREKLVKIVEDVVEIRDRYDFYPHITIARRPRPLPEELMGEVERIRNAISKRVPRRVSVFGMALIHSFRGKHEIRMWLSEPIVVEPNHRG